MLNFPHLKINRWNKTCTADLVSGNTCENYIIFAVSSSVTDKDFVGHHVVNFVDPSSEGTQTDLLRIGNELWSWLFPLFRYEQIFVYISRWNEQETSNSGRNVTVAVICLITEQISSWVAFWDFSLGVLSSLAVLSHSIWNCHLSRISPLSIFQMTTTSFWTDHLYNQSFSCSTTLFRYFISSGSLVISRGESIFLHLSKSFR